MLVVMVSKTPLPTAVSTLSAHALGRALLMVTGLVIAWREIASVTIARYMMPSVSAGAMSVLVDFVLDINEASHRGCLLPLVAVSGEAELGVCGDGDGITGAGAADVRRCCRGRRGGDRCG